MKIFPKNTESFVSQKTTKEVNNKELNKDKKGPEKVQKKALPPKKEMSPNEIREKLAANVQTSEISKNMAIASTKKLGEGFLNESIKPEIIEVVKPEIKESDKDLETPNKKDFVLKSDIAQNDPKDTNTQEKLKSVISRGAFNFNPKEREALEKILAS